MQQVRNITKDERGVSIVFACLVMVVLFVIGGIIIAYGYNNYNRAVEDKAVSDHFDVASVVAKSLQADCLAEGVAEPNTLPTPASESSISNSLQLLGFAINSAASGTPQTYSVKATGSDSSSRDRSGTAQVTCELTASGEFGEVYTFTILGDNNSSSMKFTVDVKVSTDGSTTTRMIARDSATSTNLVSNVEKVVR